MSLSLALLVMALMASDRGRRREGRRGRGGTHQSPRRMPGRHGGAVPARPTRGYLARTSPCSNREHRTSGTSTSVAHTPWPPRRRTTSTVRRTTAKSSLEAIGSGGAWARNGKGSPRRSGVCQIHLVEGVEAIGAHHLPQVTATEVAGESRNRRATAEAIRVRERVRGERRWPSWLSGSVWPTQQGG
jgi:hypothetical protein